MQKGSFLILVKLVPSIFIFRHEIKKVHPLCKNSRCFDNMNKFIAREIDKSRKLIIFMIQTLPLLTKSCLIHLFARS